MTEPITTRMPTDEQFAAAREIIRTTCCGDYAEYDAPLYVERVLGQMGVAVSPKVAWLLSLIEELWTRDAHIVLSIDNGRVEFTWREEILTKQEQLDVAREFLRVRAEAEPHEPVTLHELCQAAGVEITPAVDEMIDLIHRLWADERIHRVDSDWIEFIWQGE